jgi:hypothetical protein
MSGAGGGPGGAQPHGFRRVTFMKGNGKWRGQVATAALDPALLPPSLRGVPKLVTTLYADAAGAARAIDRCAGNETF